MAQRCLFLLILLTFVSGCSNYPLGTVLIQEKFNTPNNILQDGLYGSGAGQTEDGIFKMTVTRPGGLMIKSLGQNIIESQIEVSSYPINSDEEVFSGVVCHMIDNQNYTYFALSTIGKTQIGRVVGGNQMVLASNDITNGVVNTGAMINTVSGICTATEVIMMVNGQEVLRAATSNPSSGDVGIFAGTTTNQPVEILFDNLMVKIPTNSK